MKKETNVLYSVLDGYLIIRFINPGKEHMDAFEYSFLDIHQQGLITKVKLYTICYTNAPSDLAVTLLHHFKFSVESRLLKYICFYVLVILIIYSFDFHRNIFSIDNCCLELM